MRHSLKLYISDFVVLFLAFMYIRFDCFAMEYNHVDLGFNDSYVDHCDYLDYSKLTTKHEQHAYLTILQLNVRGVINKRDRLTDLFRDIRNDHRVDVALLVETWLNKHNAKRFKIPGYQYYGSHRKNKKGGGVGVLISQDLDCRTRKDLSLDVADFESLTVEIKTHSDSYFVCSVYRPPNSKPKEFLKHYKRLLGKFTKNQQDRLVIGIDHNLDLMKYHCHTATKDFIDINLELNLIPTITKPTRITKSTATLLDNIIVGRSFHNFTANIAISDISDHLPILMSSYQPKMYKKQPLTITSRVLDESACTKIQNELNLVDWNQLLSGYDTNTAYSCFHTKIQEVMDEISPVKTIKIKPNKILKDPWMTPGLLKCVTKQKLLYRKHLENVQNLQIKEKYRKYRNKLQEILRRTKEQYFKRKCEEFKNNTSKLWKMINRITHKLHDKSSVIEYLKIDQIDIYDSKLISEELAKHFSTVGSKYAHQIPKSKTSFNQYLQNILQSPSSMYMTPTSILEIERLIDKLPNKTSKGNDNISNMLLKTLKSSISKPMEIIFNRSIAEGVFPDDMKLADVIPLHKNNEKFLVTNYRPISLLVTISKILEKIIYQRTYSFLCKTEQLYQSQYGFRTGHSCESAIGELVGTIVKNKEQRKSTIGVFIDLSKAFDTLNHDMLLMKMEKYGIRGCVLEWFRSYLTNRKMRVKCTSSITGQIEYSTYHDLDYGTPQGSCLGPLLFLIYINDLHHVVEYCSIILFADDTTLLQGHKSLKYLKWMIEEDLKHMADWFRANLLTINVNKTECVLFHSSNTNSQHTIDLDFNGTLLHSREYVRFLGLWIDHSLSWRFQISNLLMKIKQNTHLLKVGNKFLTKSSKKLVYYAHIYSHISYGLVIWGNMLDKSTQAKIQKCMDKCFNLITHQPPTRDNYKHENMLTFEDLLYLENTKLGYKMEHNLLPRKLHQMLTSDSKLKPLTKSHHYETRTKDIPYLPTAQIKKYHDSFLFQSIKAYEGVPVKLRSSNKLTTFSFNMKRRLLKN